MIPAGVDAYKIIPTTEVKQKNIDFSRDKQSINESFTAPLIPLENISSEDALRFIQPLVSRDGHTSSFGPSNLLLVIDSGLNVGKI